ncbi:MAG: 2-amino-4-hydroxy-6-hydroxymethyldihydropteridine diphosphokinase [Candidatus Omnitrophota bacterium]|nr:2-amino-4-hydroxy-6-hydroxymethyldihydropteridine diphosphokinase [Candidatus Omnitrophota bacterium]
MATVYLALGSNLGDRHSSIRQAVDLLNIAGVHVRHLSTIIETEPVGGPVQGKFLNAVLEAHTDLSPHQLLSKIKAIEVKLGRVHREVDGPREIDIDILLYDDLVTDLPDLTIPHPRMLERAFVMDPLKEIAPHIAEALTRAHH